MRSPAPPWCSFKESLAGPSGSTCARVACQSPASSRKGPAQYFCHTSSLAGHHLGMDMAVDFRMWAATAPCSQRSARLLFMEAQATGRSHVWRSLHGPSRPPDCASSLCADPARAPDIRDRQRTLPAVPHPKSRPTESRSIGVTGVSGRQDLG